MKIIATVENKNDLRYEFEFSHHWRIGRRIFIQGTTEDSFLTFSEELERAEEVYEMILEAYELDCIDFTINFPEEHAKAFEVRKSKAQVLEEVNSWFGGLCD